MRWIPPPPTCLCHTFIALTGSLISVMADIHRLQYRCITGISFPYSCSKTEGSQKAWCKIIICYMDTTISYSDHSAIWLNKGMEWKKPGALENWWVSVCHKFRSFHFQQCFQIFLWLNKLIWTSRTKNCLEKWVRKL